MEPAAIAPPAGVPWTLDLSIPGEVVPWARAGRGGGQTFTPAKQRGYMTTIKQIAALDMGGEPPREGPLGLYIVAKFLRPKSASKRKPPVYKSTKPDADNIAKIVKDALTGIVWRDDAQVAYLAVRKVYASIPGLSVGICALEPA